MKRYERLGWKTVEGVGLDISLTGIKSPSTALEDIDEIVWDKSQRVSDRSLIAIKYFALEDDLSAKMHAVEVVRAADEYFFGTWRSKTYTTEDGDHVDEALLRQDFKWMFYFEPAVLWASVLGDWKFLKKLGTYPKPDSHIDSDFGKQGRDMYVALGAFLRDAPDSELQTLLERAAAGPKKLCKLAVALIRAVRARGEAVFQKELIELLKYYKKNEFPKNFVPSKISFEGTFFVHWAEKEKIALTVPPEFEDHIVRLK